MRSGGVRFYTDGEATVTTHFPENDVVCRWCHLFLRYEEAFKRYSCRLTNEWILDPSNEIGQRCPLKFKEDNDGSRI